MDGVIDNNWMGDTKERHFKALRDIKRQTQ